MQKGAIRCITSPAIHRFSIARPKDATDLLADPVDSYPIWLEQRGKTKAGWFCYARLFSYFAHHLVEDLWAPQRNTSR